MLGIYFNLTIKKYMSQLVYHFPEYINISVQAIHDQNKTMIKERTHIF